MTSYATETIVCSACGHVLKRDVVVSSSVFGSPDLDTRPSEMERSTIHTWIQRCPSCGFCSGDLTKFDERFRSIISGSPYRSQLADTRFPDLASTFMCEAMLVEAVGRREDAGWAYLHAAWALDDAMKADLARNCRSRAADMFLALLAEGRSFSDTLGASEAIASDCLRRAGRGVEALQVIDRALSQSYDEVIHKVLVLQKTLIQREDTSRHLIKEAIGPGSDAECKTRLEQLRQRQLEIEESHLERARGLLPPSPPELAADYQRLISEYRSCLDHHELELALDMLQELGDLVPCRGGYWRNLERAAKVMDLNARIPYLRRRFEQSGRGNP